MICGKTNIINGTEFLSVGMIAKAAGDFAIISASNRERILHLLMAAHANDRTTPSASHLSRSTETEKSEMATSVATDAPTYDNSNVAATLAAKVTDALVIDSVEIPVCDAGATTWLAFKCIHLLVKSLKDLAVSIDGNETYDVDLLSSRCRILSGLVNTSFAPSVSMLQHFIRRMLGSPVIVSKVLSSYDELCCAAMAVGSQYKLQLIMSLCKLCLPSWGKRRPNWYVAKWQDY